MNVPSACSMTIVVQPLSWRASRTMKRRRSGSSMGLSGLGQERSISWLAKETARRDVYATAVGVRTPSVGRGVRPIGDTANSTHRSLDKTGVRLWTACWRTCSQVCTVQRSGSSAGSDGTGPRQALAGSPRHWISSGTGLQFSGSSGLHCRNSTASRLLASRPLGQLKPKSQ